MCVFFVRLPINTWNQFEPTNLKVTFIHHDDCRCVHSTREYAIISVLNYKANIGGSRERVGGISILIQFIFF